jgi:hypothetical protein
VAHTFGTNSTHASSTANPATFSFACAAEDTVLVLMLKVDGGTDRTGGAPDYAGLTMTQASTTQKGAASPEASCELWYLVNPPTGTYTVSIPNAGSLTVWHMAATARAKPGGKSAFDAAAGAGTTAANPSPGAVTTTEDGDALFAVVATGAQTWAPSAQAGTVLNNNDDGAHGTGRQYLMQSALGAVTLNWTFATSDDYGAVVAAFKEFPPGRLINYQRARSTGLSVGGIG